MKGRQPDVDKLMPLPVSFGSMILPTTTCTTAKPRTVRRADPTPNWTSARRATGKAAMTAPILGTKFSRNESAYFWKIEVLKSLEFLKEIILKNLNQLKNQIKSRETKRFYVCERCNVEFTEENAMLHDFTCNECGEIFSVKSNEKVLKEFKKNEEKLGKKLELVNEEIKKEKEKIDKDKTKRNIKNWNRKN